MYVTFKLNDYPCIIKVNYYAALAASCKDIIHYYCKINLFCVKCADRYSYYLVVREPRKNTSQFVPMCDCSY